MHGYFNAAHDVNTIISRAIPSRANCMGHELLENAEWKHHLFNTYTHTRTHALDFRGCTASSHMQAE